MEKKKITVLLFANLREKAGRKQLEFEIPLEATVGDLKRKIIEEHPVLRPHLVNILISVNQKIALDDDILPSGAEVAIFPPVSGGAGMPTLTEITEEPLNLDTVVRKITEESAGAVCAFIGIVRGQSTRQPRRTWALDYEAYKPMAEKKLTQISEEIRSKYPGVHGVAIIQRIGKHMDVGTPTVIVACSSSHRNDGIFEAIHYGIDRLKEIVPVWKKEIGPEGELWIEGH